MIDQRPASIAAGWWREIQPKRADGTNNPTANRGALARLRRATLTQAMCEPETFRLPAMLNGNEASLPHVALCAAVLASLRDDSDFHPARALGPSAGSGEETAVMKPLRFRRLIEANDPEDQLLTLRRAAALADRTLNVRWMAGACLDWSDATRRRWVFNYYNAGSAAPIEPGEIVAEETET